MEYKLVPLEPTREMRKAGRGGWATSDPEEAARATYQAMLAAAPSPSWVKVSEEIALRAINAELLGALKGLFAVLDPEIPGSPDSPLERARAAIAKAEEK